jgi:glycosyltransferase involved in cell wall biosynthesis
MRGNNYFIDRVKLSVMKISLCTTTLNEGKTIGILLKDILIQTILPSEIIIVDGGSKDETVTEIKKYTARLKEKCIKLILLTLKSASISKGRNTSIKYSTGEIIVCADAGCRLNKNWLEKITKPFNNQTTFLVAGFYHMTTLNLLGRAASLYMGIVPERYNTESFLPSTRSLAFRKKVWLDVKGFSEKFDRAGEDTQFVSDILNKGYKITRVKDAIVYWEVPGDIKNIFWKFFYYAKGDAQSGIWFHPAKKYGSHNMKILSIFIRYVAFLILPFVFGRFHLPYCILFLVYLSYLIWPNYKFRDLSLNWRVRVLLPFMQILSDIAVMLGFISGSCSKIGQ